MKTLTLFVEAPSNDPSTFNNFHFNILTIGGGEKTETISYIPNGYQSLAIDQRVEQLEKAMENVVRQEDLLQQLT